MYGTPAPNMFNYFFNHLQHVDLQVQFIRNNIYFSNILLRFPYIRYPDDFSSGLGCLGKHIRLVYTRAEESWAKLENWFVLLWQNFHTLLSPYLCQPVSAKKILCSEGNCSTKLSPNLSLSKDSVDVLRGIIQEGGVFMHLHNISGWAVVMFVRVLKWLAWTIANRVIPDMGYCKV